MNYTYKKNNKNLNSDILDHIKDYNSTKNYDNYNNFKNSHKENN